MSPRAFVVLIGLLLIAAGFASNFVVPESPASGFIYGGLVGLGVLTLIGSTVTSKSSKSKK
jgi:hypothetical protein